MKKILLIVVIACLPLSGVLAEHTNSASNKQTYKEKVVLACDLHCQGCCDKIMKNIAWEKGVKDIVCDLKNKTVPVTYDTRKTDVPTLLAAFERIDKPAKVVQKNENEGVKK